MENNRNLIGTSGPGTFSYFLEQVNSYLLKKTDGPGSFMDILDRYRSYEAWTFRHFIVRCRDLTPSQLLQLFDIGYGTVHATVDHILEVFMKAMNVSFIQPEQPRGSAFWLSLSGK